MEWNCMFLGECKPEMVLITSLTTVSRKKREHAGGKTRVLRKLTRNYRDSKGIIDEDPHSTQPPDIRRFREIEYSKNNNLRILHHAQRNNRLIVLCPRLEEWIIQAAREVNIDLRRYELPTHPDELHEIINIRIEKFQRLIEELMQRSNRVRALRRYMRERIS